MQIKGKSVRSLIKYFPQIGHGKPFRIGIPIEGVEDTLERLGFQRPFEEGISILPTVVGKVTEFNAHGKDLVRKDLPMITKSRMIYTTTYDWHGNPHSGFQYRDYKSYPRDHIDGPEEEIILLNRSGVLIAVSDVLHANADDEDRAIHIINLFLECFGECELLQSNVDPIVKIKKLHWKILPPGEYPWDKAKSYIREITRHFQENDRAVIDYRIQHITLHQPDFVALGTGGFNGYFVFGFTQKGLFVLESAHFDNATYVFKSDWQHLSSLTKKEILSNQLHHERLIHSRGWPKILRNLLEGKSTR